MFMLLSYFLLIVNNSNNKDMTYYISKYIIENINHIENLSLQDIADGCYISVPTVKQFLKKFGYSHYSLFKERLIVELGIRNDQIYHGYESFDPQLLMETMYRLSCSNDYENFCNYQMISFIVDKIYQANRIIILGSPTITPILSNFQVDMVALGKTVIMSSIVEGNFIDLSSHDLVIMISGTGRLFTLNDSLINHLNQHDSPVIIFSGDKRLYPIHHVISQVNIITRNEMFETEYLIMYYFDLLRWTYFKTYKEDIHD